METLSLKEARRLAEDQLLGELPILIFQAPQLGEVSDRLGRVRAFGKVSRLWFCCGCHIQYYNFKVFKHNDIKLKYYKQHL